MRFNQTPLSGLIAIRIDAHVDNRGFFSETYRRNLFRENGIEEEFVQENHTRSMKGTLRGLHYQIEPQAQSKLVRVTQGAIFDAVVDLRSNSPTFGKWHAEELSSTNQTMLYVPEGFAHGFLALEDNTEVVYKVSNYYAPELERGIIWNDETLNIPWPKLGMDYLISPKDKKLPKLEQIT